MKANEIKLPNLPNLFKHSLNWTWPNFIVANKKGKIKTTKNLLVYLLSFLFFFSFSHFEDIHVIKSCEFTKNRNTQRQVETDIFTGRKR